MIGETLSHYEILEKIGAGGMGEVYRAHDLRLHRQVALKFLPDLFAGDPERLARFEREAKFLAALSHPNIAAIYGFEEAEGKHFLVLELVEGETLAQRVHKGPLPADEVLETIHQIADGLEAAHEKGIIHRDLKPSNIKLTPEGKIKILDFGLARAFLDKSPVGDIADSPTIMAEMTQPGVILGTAAYMSPEQAKGKPVDKRVDIWAFGCILFECLTGRMAFPGETISEVLAAVLKGEPDWDALPKDLSPNVRAVLARCLQKNRDHRYRDIGDALLDIEDSGPEPRTETEVGRSYRWVRWTIPLSVGLTVLGTLLIHNLTSKKDSIQAPAIVRYAIPGAFSSYRQLNEALDLSPDGERLVYVGEREGRRQLFLRSLDRMESVPLDSTENAQAPFFSPDGQHIGFFAGGKLKQIAVTGGAPTVIFETVGICGSWGLDDMIVFTPRWGSGLFTVPAAGGAPKALTTPNPSKGEMTHVWPQILPARNAVLFTIVPGDISSANDAYIAVQEAGQPEPRILIRGGTYGRYVTSGHLVYNRKGTLLAVPFNLKTLQVNGAPIVLLENIRYDDLTGVAHFAVSMTGTMAYAFGEEYQSERTLVRVDLRGNMQPLLQGRWVYDVAYSLDGRIALRIAATNDDIWIFKPERQQLSRLTSGFGDEVTPVWTPDGKYVIFAWRDNDLAWQAADGSGESKVLFTGEYELRPGSVSPDGSVLAFTESNPQSRGDIWFLPLKGERKPQKFLGTSFDERGPKFSPNGRWIAFSSDESGRNEIYIQRLKETGGKRLVSTTGGIRPRWSPTGDQLFFSSGQRIMAVKIDPESGAQGPVVLLFESRQPDRVMDYDVAPDGKGFAMTTENEQPSIGELRVILNWFEELKRLVPVGKK